jgi:DNA-binding SARP family transcriptional activator
VPTLQLLLLGALGVRYDDQSPPKPPTLKSQSLLAYLVTHRRQPQSRKRLANLAWRDRPERKVCSSLSTAPWQIRRSFSGRVSILIGLIYQRLLWRILWAHVTDSYTGCRTNSSLSGCSPP